MLHAIVEEQCLIPLRKRPLETTCTLQVPLVSKLYISIDSIKVDMIVIADLLIGSSLILEGIEEGIAMHVDIGLLPEESLPIATELIKETSVVIVLHHHLLLFELVLIILELLDSLERRLSDRHILG